METMMDKIDELERKIADLYSSVPENTSVEATLPMLVEEWMSFSQSYLSSAETVEKDKPQNWLPIRQLVGQSVELALKACILSTNETPRHGHNLIEFMRICYDKGFEIEDPEIAAIIHLNHFYFKDIFTESKFKSRYPTNSNEALGGVVPEVKTYANIVNSLYEQAKQQIVSN